jgi:type II secretory pathway component GspD/PulD (secretin)
MALAGATVPSLMAAAPPGPGTLAVLENLTIVGQAQARPSRAHIALNSAIEANRRGDYAQAAILFQEAQAGFNDLTPQEQQELTRGMESNTAALAARKEGASQLAEAEEALKSGKGSVAADLLKKVVTNQYVSAADKEKATKLLGQVKPRDAAGGDGETNASNLARFKVQQAKVMLGQGNFDAAEQLALEATSLKAVYNAGEDTPAKVLEDVHKARTDPKVMLSAARTALQRGDLNKAEELAHASEKADSSWNFHLWGDSPAAVLKDVAAARAKGGAVKPSEAGKEVAQTPAKDAMPSAPEKQEKEKDKKDQTTFGSVRGMFNTANKPDSSAAPAAPADAADPAKEKANAENARQLLQQARKALQDGNLTLANDCCQRARSLKPKLEWWDDTPDRVQADIQRAQGNKEIATAVAKTPSTATDKTDKGVKADKGDKAPMAADKGDKAPKATDKTDKGTKTADTFVEPTSKDPHVLVKTGRELLAAGKLDEAAKVAQKARSLSSSTRWGLFEYSPDSLMQDIDKARAQRDQDESVKVLAEGRKLYDQKDLDGAEKAAYRALKLHGPYSIWDMGDRPQKLIAEIQTTRDQNRKKGITTPATAVAKKDDKGEDPKAPQARRMLAEARKALKDGDPARAMTLAAQVEYMNIRLDRPGDDTPEAVRRDVALAHGAPPAGMMPPPPGMPPPPSAMAAAAPEGMQRARQLLRECRQLQYEGKLVEARQKALEARAFAPGGFATGEDSAEQVLVHLNSLCYKRIDRLMQESSECANSAGSDAARWQKAEQSLVQARMLAAGFGQDTQPVDARMAQLQQQRVAVLGGSPSAPGQVHVASGNDTMPGGPVPAVGTTPAAPGNPGLTLLEQARAELRKGETPQARKLAEEAFRGNYGVQTQAEALLRTIDAEEVGQQKLAASRTFEAGVSALRRKDYAQAGAILRSLDRKLLDEDKQNRLKDLLGLAELQPGRLAQAGVVTADAKVPSGTPPAPVPVTPGGDVGTAHVSDTVAQKTETSSDLLKTAQAMQDIKFQQLRQQGLEAQREAADRFKTGDTDRALEVLQEYAQSLNNTQLDSDRVALLKRPIDARLLQFKTLKAQRDFEKSVLNQRSSQGMEQTKLALLEKNKQEKVAELMKQNETAYRDAKYKEAEMYAAAAHELDPDNAAASAALQIARIHAAQAKYQKIKQGKEEHVLHDLDDAEDEGPILDTHDPLHIDVERTKANLANRKAYANGIHTPVETDKEKEIKHHLDNPQNLNFTDTPLDAVLEDLRSWNSINIVPDVAAIEAEGISLKRPVSMKLENVSLKSALNLLLNPLHLSYTIKDEVLLITTEKQLRGKLSTVTYQVADLVIPIENFGMPNAANLMRTLDRVSDNAQGLPVKGGVTPYTNSNSLLTGQPVSTPQGSQNGASGWASNQGPVNGSASSSTHGPLQTQEELLIKLITNTIAPQSWDEMGGPGHIEYFPLAMALVVNQTPDIQEQVAELLAALRRLLEQEVTIEVRFISIAEGFFERIGVNFNVNFLTKNGSNVQSELTQQQFQLFPLINNFQPDNFVSGLTPAGTFTSDLNIPLNASSFGMAIPPFGAFPQIPGANGGLSLGLAFLSDIQVFLFMEAAQGDQRTNVMQAPKITMFNGQTSTISVLDQQFFVTNVNIIQANGQLAFIPTNQPFPTGGVTLTIQSVISADRRYVRMSLTPNITNLTSAIVPLFPIVTPIIPTFEGGFQGQPVIFTQFLQQPVITAITVNTTVSVPDGGTVLLGGLKKLSEGRNEFGPPVLSKIPYINRLFKNVGYGREAESLMIMVTPRIIINEEEEFNATGVSRQPPP